MPTATRTAKKPARKRTAKKAAPAPAPEPTAKHTPARHVRIPDEVWEPGQANAVANGYTGVSELLRDLLRDYNDGKRMVAQA